MRRHETFDRALALLKRQGVALLGLAMIAAGGIWAAVALGASEITVQTPTGNKTIDVAALKQEDVHKEYNIGGQPKRVDGYSLQRVLSSENIGAKDWTRIFFDGGVIVNGEKFVKNRKPAFYFEDREEEEPQELRFVVPKREREEGRIEEILNFNLRGAIDIDPDEVDPEQGDTQTFEANVINGGPQNKYDFTWRASTGETGSERKFEITFNTSGDVDISVFAKRAGDPVAEGAIATKVKEPPSQDDGSGSSGFGGTGPSYTPPFTPSTPDYSPNFPDSTPSPDTPAPPDPDSAPEIEEETGTSVAGELLSATSPLPAPSGEEGPTAEDESEPAPEEVADEAKEVSAPGALIAGGVIVGLLGLGAGRELEDKRPLRLLKRPDFSALRRLSPPWK